MAGKVIGEEAGKTLVARIKSLLAGKSDTGHTHSYAGSASAGGSATSAIKLDSSAGSATKPVYFTGGKPAACSYTLEASVPSGAKFTDTTYSAATSSAAGLMSAADKSKLDGIAAGANNYTHPTTSGNKHIPSGGISGQVLQWSSNGTAKWYSPSALLYSNSTGSTSATFVSEVSGFSYFMICIKNAQGACHWVTAKAEAGDCPFETHGVTDGTMWVVFGTLSLSAKAVRITSQVNMPITGYVFEVGKGNTDCKIVAVVGFR